ncbi:MAG TPA: GDP-mannose 4,6-dehydratase [Thermoanaerobaculia bacterium]|nr:GDP-mannose 4,6-dehydratase [Thermoanaerobaculia bacterium]
MKRALITGVTGQDGSYLAELLLGKGYEVHGIVRRSSSIARSRIDHLSRWQGGGNGPLLLHYGDLNDSSSLNRVLRTVRPDEIYNLGAQSDVRASFELPEYTGQIDALGTTRLLDAILETGLTPRFYQASTSEVFGKARETPQSETTPFHPRSPYGVAKAYAHWITVNYREAYGFHASNGILFNHESPRRGESFVTRKITRAVGRIAHGQQDAVYLGNLAARRDWGFAGDYIEGIWRMLQADEPGDYVLATREAHTVREFAEAAFARAGIPIRFEGEGVEERGVDAATGAVRVAIDPRYFRPSEVDHLVGDYAKAREKLGWEPTVRFPQLVAMMTDADMELARREAEGARPGAPDEAHRP